MSLPLTEFNSECDAKAKEIVSKDRKSKSRHIAKNDNNSLVRQLKIDGYVIKDNNIKKCDYLVLNDDNCTAYFIELKGGDMINAIKQIESSVDKLKQDLVNYDKKLRIVYSGQVESGTILAWQKKNKNAKAKRIIFEENI